MTDPRSEPENPQLQPRGIHAGAGGADLSVPTNPGDRIGPAGDTETLAPELHDPNFNLHEPEEERRQRTELNRSQGESSRREARQRDAK